MTGRGYGSPDPSLSRSLSLSLLLGSHYLIMVFCLAVGPEQSSWWPQITDYRSMNQNNIFNLLFAQTSGHRDANPTEQPLLGVQW